MSQKVCFWKGCTEPLPEKPLKGWGDITINIFSDRVSGGRVDVATTTFAFCPDHVRMLMEHTQMELPSEFKLS